MEADSANYELLFLYAGGGFLFVSGMLALSRWLQKGHPRRRAQVTKEAQQVAQAPQTAYECGEEPVGDARYSFSWSYYLIALLFVLFELELLFLLPWAQAMGAVVAASRTGAWVAFWEISFFVALLGLGLVYAWREGRLWQLSPRGRAEDRSSCVPEAMYESLNVQYEGKRASSAVVSS